MLQKKEGKLLLTHSKAAISSLKHKNWNFGFAFGQKVIVCTTYIFNISVEPTARSAYQSYRINFSTSLIQVRHNEDVIASMEDKTEQNMTIWPRQQAKMLSLRPRLSLCCSSVIRGVASQRFYREFEPLQPQILGWMIPGSAGQGWFLYSRLKSRPRSAPTDAGAGPSDSPVLLRDTDQPFVYDIRFSKKKFTLELYDTSSPNKHWTSLKPDVVVLAFDISNRESLAGLREVSSHASHCPVRSRCWQWPDSGATIS